MALTVARSLMGVAQGSMSVPIGGMQEEPLDPEVKKQQSEFEQVFMRITANHDAMVAKKVEKGGAKSWPASRTSSPSKRQHGYSTAEGEPHRSKRPGSPNSSEVGSAQSGPVVVDCEGASSPKDTTSAQISRKLRNEGSKKESCGQNSQIEGIAVRLAAVEEQLLFMQREIDDASCNWNVTMKHQETIIERMERDVNTFKEQLQESGKTFDKLWQKHMETCSNFSGAVGTTDIKVIIDAVLKHLESSNATATAASLGSSLEESVSRHGNLACQISQELQTGDLKEEAGKGERNLHTQLHAIHNKFSAKFDALGRGLNGKPRGERGSFCAASDTTIAPSTTSLSFGTVRSSIDHTRKGFGNQSGAETNRDPLCQSARSKSPLAPQTRRTLQQPASEPVVVLTNPRVAPSASPHRRPVTTGQPSRGPHLQI